MLDAICLILYLQNKKNGRLKSTAVPSDIYFLLNVSFKYNDSVNSIGFLTTGISVNEHKRNKYCNTIMDKCRFKNKCVYYFLS